MGDPEVLMAHMKSNHFSVVCGAMSLLREPYEMMYYDAFHPSRWRKGSYVSALTSDDVYPSTS